MTYLNELKKELVRMSTRITGKLDELNDLIPDDNPEIMVAYIRLYNRTLLSLKQEIQALNHKKSFLKNMQRIDNLAPKDKLDSIVT